MDSGKQRPVVIDATDKRSADLLPALTQALYAASPANQAIGKVTVYSRADDATHWPEHPWLSVLKDGQPEPSTYAEAQQSTPGSVEEFLEEFPQAYLVSLNVARISHPYASLLLSDWVAANFVDREKNSGLLGKLKTRISAHAFDLNLRNVSSVITLSHFARSQVFSIAADEEQAVRVIPVGIDPDFFRPKYTHRLVDRLTYDKPFMWLSCITHESVNEILATVKAIEALRKLGAFVELTLLFNESINGRDVSKDDLKRIHKATKICSFVDIVSVKERSDMLPYYLEADGFVWGQETDRNYEFLLNAMASGLPVIAASTDMNKKHLGNRLRFFRSTDESDLADTLERSMADIHFRIIGSARNHKRSMNYTWEKMAYEFFQAIQEDHQIPTVSSAAAL